jgi:hypothetical protein
MSGTFAVFDTPSGGLHLAFRPDGAEEDTHVPIPAVAAELLRRAASGETIGPAALLKSLTLGKLG